MGHGSRDLPRRRARPLPAGVSIRVFRTGDDEHVLYEVAEAAFQDHWDHHPQSFEAYSAEMFEADDWSPSLAYFAELEGQVVGEVVALALSEYGYIASVGVLRQARVGGSPEPCCSTRSLRLPRVDSSGWSCPSTPPTRPVPSICTKRSG